MNQAETTGVPELDAILEDIRREDPDVQISIQSLGPIPELFKSGLVGKDMLGNLREDVGKIMAKRKASRPAPVTPLDAINFTSADRAAQAYAIGDIVKWRKGLADPSTSFGENGTATITAILPEKRVQFAENGIAETYDLLAAVRVPCTSGTCAEAGHMHLIEFGLDSRRIEMHKHYE